MNKRSWLTALLLILVATSLGCSGRAYHFANVELDESRYEKLGYAEASAGGVLLLGVIPIRQNSKINRAVTAAIAKKGGDELIDVSVTEGWFYAVVLNGHRVHVRGMVVKNKK